MIDYSLGGGKLDDTLQELGVAERFGANLARLTDWLHTFEKDMPGFANRAGEQADLDAIAAAAERIRQQASDLIVLGTGGSSLGAQAALALARVFKTSTVTIHTPDSLCPFEMDRLFADLDPARTHVLAISKSGSTAETLAQLITAHDWIVGAASPANPADHFTVITEPGERALRTYADRLGSPVLDHPTDVGGRFSVLTNVGMLPVAVAGLDVTAFRGGASQTLNHVLSGGGEGSMPVVGAALAHTFASEKGMNMVQLMPYAEALRPFTRWHGQLWAESLGKDGKGTTPIRAVGPVDQHSQLQLYADGPNDKFYTLITIPSHGKGPVVSADQAREYGLDYMAGRTIGDIVTCQARATAETLRSKGRPVRMLTIDALNAENMGRLFMSFMLETVFTAHLMGVDAYDQPGVEDSKILTRKYLSELD
ncbi:glucose-6-phosphate isomerase [Yunchengibacter salinarum]|uniref:glucose-6-phosphate isomerase n=1 Tax=Yunchengibacter salinarum TaxID=3133399 RepID=UPI0035B610C3